MFENLKGILLNKVSLMAYLIVSIAIFMQIYKLIPNPVMEDIFVRFIPSIGIFFIAFIAENDFEDEKEIEENYDFEGLSGILIPEICAFLFILFLISIYGIFHFFDLAPKFTYEIQGLKMLIDIYIMGGTIFGLAIYYIGIAILTVIKRK